MSAPGETNEGARSGAPFLILTWAGLAGAGGVALAATAAHRVESPALAIAATMLTLHAVAAVAIVALGLHAGYGKAFQGAALLMLAAATLFSSEVALFTLKGTHIFPMAAPTGGSLMIVSWLIVAGLAIAGWLKRR
jgi:uncharacterized membrane protein YgdD (TMEM256/DUF423 family)